MAENKPYIPLYIQFRHIKLRVDQRVSQPITPYFKYWHPPHQPEQFVVDADTMWYEWNPGRMIPVPQNCVIQEYERCSIYWCPDRQDYCVLSIDCTLPNPQHRIPTLDAQEGTDTSTENEGEEKTTDSGNDSDFEPGLARPLPWRRLQFRHVEWQNKQCISLVGFGYENWHLGTTAPRRWFNQLLQPTCKSARSEQYQGDCALAGNLALLIGLCTLSRPREYAAQAVAECFRPNLTSTDFRPHNYPIGDRLDRRGLVVIIGYNPGRFNKSHLDRWQGAMYGPILT